MSGVRSSRWTLADIPDQRGRVAVVTGANSGLGLAVSEALAGAGAHVVMACRNRSKAQDAAASVMAKGPTGSVEVVELDLADLSSVAACAESLATRFDHIDLLADNAGLMAVDEGRTTDGFEVQIGVNHLGHFALTGRLLPTLEAAPAARVVTMASVGHRAGRLHLDDLMAERRPYRAWSAYFQSKLANLLFTRELQRRLATSGSRTIAVAAHPGFTHTDLGVEGSGLLNSLAGPAGSVLAMRPSTGALPFLRAATEPDVPGGTYWGPRWMVWGPPVRETPSRAARDDADARRLWELSEELTGVQPSF